MAEGPQTVIRKNDPLLACAGQLAARFGVSFAPAMFASLARGEDGRLPLHQAEPALELLGLNCEAFRPAKLPRQPSAYPAIVSLGDGGPAVVHELRDRDMLIWRPATGVAQWEPLGRVQGEFGGWLATVFGDPTLLRETGQPWETQARSHWFWSEFHKARRDFWPVLVASLLINLLALALALFSMNVSDRVTPNWAQATLWVLALGVGIAFAMDYALRRARSKVLDEIGRELDLKLSQKIFSKLLAAPLAERKGHTGNLVARVSEFAIVRDFFASTTIVLIVDMAFLVLFVALIAYIAGLLAFVPLIAMLVMAIYGFRLQRQVVQAAKEAQADHGLQQTLLVESVAGMETLKSVAGEGAMLGRWRRLAEMG